MLIIPSMLLALLFVLLLCALIRLPNRPAGIIAAYLFFFTNILSSLLLAAALGGLASRYVVLLIQLVMAAAAYAVWLRRGRPALFGWLRPLMNEIRAGWKIALRRWPEICLLTAALIGAFAVFAFLIWWVPPNNNDSLSTHLSRIGYWLQHNSLLPWETFNPKQVFYPLNAALQVYWTVLMLGSDRLAGIVQWIGGLASIVCVFGIARLIGWTRPQSAFAALVYGSFPIILLQSTTTQLDLVSAAIFLPTVYFLILGIKTSRRAMYILSGLSLGLALGTKQTLLFLLPGLAVFLLLQARHWKRNPRHLSAWAAAAAGFFILLSSPIYVISAWYYGSPFGPPEVVSASTGGMQATDILASLKYNVPRLTYQFFDFSGMPEPISEFGYRARRKLGIELAGLTSFSLETPAALAENHQFAYAYKTHLSEDESWFGVPGFLFLLPAAVQQLIHGLRKKDSLRVGLVLFALIYLPVVAALRPGWDPFQGRYFIAACAALAPFIGVVVQPGWWSRVVRWLAAVIAVTTIVVVLLYNPAKPFDRDKIIIFASTRQDLTLLQGGQMRGYLNLISQTMPEKAVVGYYSPSYIWDYPLFGEGFNRKVIPIVAVEKLEDVEWLRSMGIEYILVNYPGGDPGDFARGLVEVDSWGDDYLIVGWDSISP